MQRSSIAAGHAAAHQRRKRLTEEAAIGQLERWNVRLSGATVVDIGAGRGGGTVALERAGARAIGAELNPELVEAAKGFAVEEGSKCVFVCHNAEHAAPPEYREIADGAVLQEVIEHVPDPEATLHATLSWLKPGGWCYVSFPPYRSPAGGHHHYARKPFRYVPWLHLMVPKRTLLSFLPDNPRYIEEVATLNKITISRFERFADRYWRIVHRTSYLIRPSIAYQFGLPTVPAGPLARIWGFREFFVTGTEYLLQKR